MSVTLLALDTSDELCSVALLNSSGCHITKSDRARKHADEVLVMIDALLRAHQTRLAELNAIALVVGPGSFTGLRIGAAVVQGLAFGADLPVINISALAMMARAAVTQHDTYRYVVCCQHSREDEYYVAVYEDTGSGVPVAQVPDCLMTSSDIHTLVDNLPEGIRHHWLAAGKGWLQPDLNSSLQNAAEITTDAPADAGVAVRIAAATPEDQWLDAGAALPVYLKDDMAYRKA